MCSGLPAVINLGYWHLDLGCSKNTVKNIYPSAIICFSGCINEMSVDCIINVVRRIMALNLLSKVFSPCT